MLDKSTVQFLKNLKKNNVKEWFEANRKVYEAARADFGALVSASIAQHGKLDADISALSAKDCLFRINRDVRFSKNKAPYKTNMGAGIGRGGKKSFYAGYYLHIEPGGESFAGGGLWMPEGEHLKKVRQEIDYNFADFKAIVEGKAFKKMFGDLYTGENSKLSRPPKGYDEDNPAIEYLKFKSYVAIHHIDDASLTDKGLQQIICNAFAALQPMVAFINRALEEG